MRPLTQVEFDEKVEGLIEGVTNRKHNDKILVWILLGAFMSYFLYIMFSGEIALGGIVGYVLSRIISTLISISYRN